MPVATGASLFIIYENAASPMVTICVSEGNMDIPIGPLGHTIQYDITGFVAEAPVTASLSISAQDGQASADGPLYFNFNMINPDPVFEGMDPPIGNFWDTKTWDVSPYVNDGDIMGTVTYTHTGSGDCVNTIAACFSTTSEDPTYFDVREDVSRPDNVLGLTPLGADGTLRLLSGLGQDVSVSIYDPEGRLVSTRQMTGLGVGEYPLDFSDLGQGVFLAIAQSSLGLQVSTKFLKAR